jgi:hypothetical protein
VTTIAADAEKLRALEEDVSRAWSAYHESTSSLGGSDYDQAEPASWLVLQNRLRQLDRRRRLLTVTDA